MLYTLEQGPTERFLIENCIRDGRPLPKAIQDAPELDLGLDIYYIAFLHLNTCRSIGWEIGPIPWHIINEYAKSEDIVDDQRDDLFYFIQKMDAAYLEYHKKKNKAKK
ncbi:MAG: hypothetical protein PVI90_07125 [Desulfobacteraceae bacterium]|jgi:hypothetical protein